MCWTPRGTFLPANAGVGVCETWKLQGREKRSHYRDKDKQEGGGGGGDFEY